MPDNMVAVSRCDAYHIKELRKAVAGMLSDLGGMDSYVSTGDRVLLKVNMLSGLSPEKAVTTDPNLVRVICEQVLEAGGKPVIADSPGGPFTEGTLRKAYHKCGFAAVAAETGAELNYNLERRKVSFSGGQIKKSFVLADFINRVDKVINIPRLKTHGLTMYTGAVKNLFGVIPGLLKAEYHLKMQDIKVFTEMLIDLALLVEPDLNIMDGIIGMEGEGPSSGQPRNFGYLLASPSPFALDVAGVHLLGIEPPDKVPLIAALRERGLPWEVTGLDLHGDGLRVARKVKIPEIEQRSNLLDQKLPSAVSSLLNRLLRPRPVFDHSQCTGCGDCFRVCPPDAITMEEGLPEVKLEECIRCFCCQEMCDFNAVQIHRPLPGRLLNYFSGRDAGQE